jgi:hypothetical protein
MGSTVKRLAIVALLLGTSAKAQLVEGQLQSAINRAGYACPQVTHAKSLGRLKNGNALLGVACSDGGRWTVEMTTDTLELGKVLRCVWWAATGAHIPFCQQ